MKALTILWKFSRPHTIIGSVISIFTLFSIICYTPGTFDITLMTFALLIGITCNIFIVGINQVADVEIDRINKPDLPIPAGILSVKQAKGIVLTSAGLSLCMALYLSPYLFGIIMLALTIGWAYSMPPFYLKQHHIPAALAIATVRGILLNAGGFLVFNYLINHTVEMPLNIKILTLFVFVFSVVISWFKDLPDIEGDAKYHIQTLAIRYSPKAALVTGHLLVLSAYVFTIYMQYRNYKLSVIPSFTTEVLLTGHIVLLVLFTVNAFAVQLQKHTSVQKFYKRFWWFFFAEYLVYLIAYWRFEI
jgi:homogentisate phytyltransferase/homogentisate geranylgeranyltransferase